MFQNVQNRKLYQAKSAGEGEPEKGVQLSEIIEKITWFALDFERKKSPGLLLILGRCPRRALGRGGRGHACASP